MNNPRKNKRDKKAGNFYRKLNKKRCDEARHASKFMSVWLKKDENGTEGHHYSPMQKKSRRTKKVPAATGETTVETTAKEAKDSSIYRTHEDISQERNSQEEWVSGPRPVNDEESSVDSVTQSFEKSLQLFKTSAAHSSESQLTNLDTSLSDHESGPSTSEQNIFYSASYTMVPSSSITSETSLPYSSPTESSTGSTSSSIEKHSYQGHRAVYECDRNAIPSGCSDDFSKRSNDGLWLGKIYCPYTPKKEARYNVSPSPNPFKRFNFSKEESATISEDIDIESLCESEEDFETEENFETDSEQTSEDKF